MKAWHLVIKAMMWAALIPVAVILLVLMFIEEVSTIARKDAHKLMENLGYAINKVGRYK